MDIFALTLIVFFVAMGISFLLYAAGDKYLKKRSSETVLEGYKLLGNSHLWIIASFVYTGFAALVLFIFSTTFAVELIYQSIGEALYQLVVVFPIAILSFLGAYFLVRLFLSRYTLN